MDKRLEVLQKMAQEQAKLAERVTIIEKNQSKLLEHINTWVAKIEAIDKVAWASYLLHGGKPLPKLNKKLVAENKEAIQSAVNEIIAYGDKLRAEAKKEADKKKKKIIQPGAGKKGKILLSTGTKKRIREAAEATTSGNSQGPKR